MGHQLTKEDIRKMEEEIEYRKVVVRKELLQDVKTAREHGDLSENFEYHAAKKEKNKNESRIRFLERMIRQAEIVEEEKAKDRVGLNKTVTVYVEEDDEEEIFSIVTTVRVDALEGRVSIESPIGKALMGHTVGDRVEIPLPNGGEYYVVIRKIENFAEDVPLNPF